MKYFLRCGVNGLKYEVTRDQYITCQRPFGFKPVDMNFVQGTLVGEIEHETREHKGDS